MPQKLGQLLPFLPFMLLSLFSSSNALMNRLFLSILEMSRIFFPAFFLSIFRIVAFDILAVSFCLMK